MLWKWVRNVYVSDDNFQGTEKQPLFARCYITPQVFGVSESGYVNSELFVKWMDCFISHATTTKNKIVLVLNGRITHSNNWKL
jgi:hypothetical protein